MIPRRLLWKIGLKAFVVRDQDAWRGGPLKVSSPQTGVRRSHRVDRVSGRNVPRAPPALACRFLTGNPPFRIRMRTIDGRRGDKDKAGRQASCRKASCLSPLSPVRLIRISVPPSAKDEGQLCKAECPDRSSPVRTRPDPCPAFSPRRAMASRTGLSSLPRAVRRYETCGGETGRTSRATTPFASSSRSLEERTFDVIPPRSRRRSPKRRGSSQRYQRILEVQAPARSLRQKSSGQSGGGALLPEDGREVLFIAHIIYQVS